MQGLGPDLSILSSRPNNVARLADRRTSSSAGASSVFAVALPSHLASDAGRRRTRGLCLASRLQAPRILSENIEMNLYNFHPFVHISFYYTPKNEEERAPEKERN